MNLEEMKCLGWLEKELNKLTETDLDRYGPQREVDSMEDESIIGVIKSIECKKLWCIANRLKEEISELRQKHHREHIAGSPSKQDCERVDREEIILVSRCRAATDLFWCAVREKMKKVNPQIGVRKGWKLVSVPHEEEIPDITMIIPIFPGHDPGQSSSPTFC